MAGRKLYTLDRSNNGIGFIESGKQILLTSLNNTVKSKRDSILEIL